MSSTNAIITDIDFRINTMMMDLGQIKEIVNTGSIDPDNQAAAKAKRELLRIEKIAVRDRELNQRSKQSLLDSLLSQLHSELTVRLEEELLDEENIYKKVLGINENLPDVLDILSVKAASIGRIEPVIATMPWLVKDLIKMVNMPKYRRVDRKGKSIAVESLRMALSFIGIENLKMVVPAMAMRRWLPQITDPYPSIKSRLWDLSIGTAISCRKMAELVGQDQGMAFTLGMFHNLGTIVLVRLYFRLFELVLRDALKEAQDNQKKQEYDALRELKPNADFLRELIIQRASTISAKMIKRMDMRRVYISHAMGEYAEQAPIAEMSPMAKILSQASAYTKYRNLKEFKLITTDEAKDYLRCFSMPKGSLAMLKNTNLSKLDLTLNQTSDQSN
ncbi:HDOD domain-containing protein [Neptunicella sp. SCSIO 80796]|uniref:HDOD domain-containing protein n=1 Tax=Neptunicella plasticusilytica TaxID=3117012 RepID=UPI003A4DC816